MKMLFASTPCPSPGTDGGHVNLVWPKWRGTDRESSDGSNAGSAWIIIHHLYETFQPFLRIIIIAIRPVPSSTKGGIGNVVGRGPGFNPCNEKVSGLDTPSRRTR